MVLCYTYYIIIEKYNKYNIHIHIHIVLYLL